jgi:hypothetical protein
MTVLGDHQLPVGHGRHIEGHCPPPHLPQNEISTKTFKSFKMKSGTVIFVDPDIFLLIPIRISNEFSTQQKTEKIAPFTDEVASSKQQYTYTVKSFQIYFFKYRYEFPTNLYPRSKKKFGKFAPFSSEVASFKQQYAYIIHKLFKRC